MTTGAYDCSPTSCHQSYVNRHAPHKSWFAAYLLRFASLCCMARSHLHATLVSKPSWYIFLLLSQASKANASYHTLSWKLAERNKTPLHSMLVQLLWKSNNLPFVLKHLLGDLMSVLKTELPWYFLKKIQIFFLRMCDWNLLFAYLLCQRFFVIVAII